MNKSKYMAVAAVAGVVAFLMAADATAGRGRGASRRGFGKQMAATLELTNEQQVEIQQLRARMIEDLAPARARLGQLRAEMRELWQADKPSQQAIMAKHAEMDTYRPKIRARKVELRLDALNVLTPDQRAKLKQLKAKRGNKRGKRGGRGGGGGGMGVFVDGAGDDLSDDGFVRGPGRGNR